MAINNNPYTPHQITDWVQKEISDRNQKSLSQTLSLSPRTPWVRVCSNGNGINFLGLPTINQTPKNGFVFFNGEGFDKVYGLKNKQNRTLLGYTVDGEEHFIESTGGSTSLYKNSLGDIKTNPKFLASPGIVSMNVTIQKERIRRVEINWKCFTYAQLEYLTPYLLCPKLSMIVEFGWGTVNPQSLLDLTNVEKMKSLYSDGHDLYNVNMAASKGNYDVTFGNIVDYEFSSNDGIAYECKTVVMSKHRNFSGYSFDTTNKVEKNDGNTEILTSFRTFVENKLKNVPICLQNRGKNFLTYVIETSDANTSYGINTTNSKEFFNGDVENRIFVGRDASKYHRVDSNPDFSQAKDEKDWDKDNNDKSWVTMGFLVELLNNFIILKLEAFKDNSTDIRGLNEIKLDDIAGNPIYIGAHPNLISCTPDVLIPNSTAPKFNCGYYGKDFANNKYNVQFAYNEGKSHMRATDGNIVLNSVGEALKLAKYQHAVLYTLSSSNPTSNGVFKNYAIIRDDLDRIINRFRYRFGQKSPEGTFAFPDKTDSAKGKLSNIFISVDTIINAARSAKDLGDFLKSILDTLNKSVNGFWDLTVIESESFLTIIDKKFQSNQLLKEPIFQFDINASNSFIKNLSFSTNLTTAQANQNIAASGQVQKIGEVNTTKPIQFVFGDRLGMNVRNNSSDIIKQLPSSRTLLEPLQVYGKSEAMQMTFGEADKNRPVFNSFGGVDLEALAGDKIVGKKNYVNLILPQPELLKALLDDGDYINNSNVYGSQNPNFTLEMKVDGIAGLRTFQIFSIKNLPAPYSEKDVIFQITDVTHEVSNGEWNTVIRAGIRVIKNRYTPGSLKFTDGQKEYYP